MSAMIASAIVADIDLDLVEAFRLNKVINDQRERALARRDLDLTELQAIVSPRGFGRD